MNYTAILEKLKTQNLKVTRRGIVDCVSGKRRKETAQLLAMLDTSESEIVKIFTERAGTVNSDEKLFGVDTESFSKVVPVSPIIETVPQFNDIDRRSIGKKIAFAFNPMDKTPILCVHLKDNQWIEVPLSQSRASNITNVYTAFSMSSPINTDGRFKNFAEELDAIAKLPLDKAIQMANAGSFKNGDEMYDFIAKHTSGLMLNTATLRFVVLNMMIEHPADDDKPIKIKIPKTAKFTKGDSTMRYSMIECIVDNISYLASLPELNTRAPVILSNDPNEPSLNYIDLDTICHDMPTPTWDEYAERFTENEYDVFKAFIWSCFNANNISRQLLYIYDPDGFSGKSVVLSVIAKHLGPNICAALQKDSLNNQFSLAKVWDKRLVTIDDNKNPLLIRSEKMHMMLGGGMADIEMKGRNSFTARLRLKVIAAGNTQLQIDPYSDHERSRLLVITPKVSNQMKKRYCQTDENGELILVNGKPILKGDPTFEQRLDAEFPGFISQCREAYSRLCPTDGNIVPSVELNNYLFSLSTTQDDVFDNILEGFTVDPSAQCSPIDFMRGFNSGLRRVALDCNAKEGKMDYTSDDFFTYLTKRYSFIRRTRPHRGPRIVVGITPREDDHPDFINLGAQNASAS